MIDVKVEGLEELKKRLDTKRFAAASKVAIGKCAEEVKIEAIPYPPEGNWNSPRGYGSAFDIGSRKVVNRWYQRLYGARWARVDGSVGGRNTSEQMQQRWYTQVKNSWEAKVANKASYAPWVKGEDQAQFHKAHGWMKLSDDASNLAKRGVFLKIFTAQVEKALEG